MPMVGRLETMVKPTPLSCSCRTARYGAVGQGLVLGQQRAVDIGNNERDAGHERFLRGAPLSSGTRLELADDIIDDGLDRSVDRYRHGIFAGVGGSSVLNWLASRPGGMKWPLRWASRSAINCCVPSR